MEDLHIGVQVLCVFTSASNPNSFYGVKFWGYIDFSRVCTLSPLECVSFANTIQADYQPVLLLQAAQLSI